MKTHLIRSWLQQEANGWLIVGDSLDTRDNTVSFTWEQPGMWAEPNKERAELYLDVFQSIVENTGKFPNMCVSPLEWRWESMTSLDCMNLLTRHHDAIHALGKEHGKEIVVPLVTGEVA